MRNIWNWVGILVLILIVFFSFKSCYQVDLKIAKKPSLKQTVISILGAVEHISGRVDKIDSKLDGLTGDVRNLKHHRHNYQPQSTTENYEGPSRPQSQQYREQQPAPRQQESYDDELIPQGTSTDIIPGAQPGPGDLLFCIDLEPAKSADSSKKFLFWELVNNMGYSIANVVPNGEGKPANMRLTPGSSADGISFDGSILKIRVSSLNSWYGSIFGTNMPSDYRPGIRSNKSGWGTKLMTRSGDCFVYRF